MNELYYRHHVFCCTNKRPDGHARGCCIDRGGGHLRDYMKRRAKELGLVDIRINAGGCLDRCEHGPCMVVYPEGIWYACKNEKDVEDVIQEHILDGNVVTRLQLPGKKET